MPRRALTALECAEAALVFGPGVATARVGVWENHALPHWVAALGRGWQRARGLAVASNAPNAIALGPHLLFARALEPTVGDYGWLIHELAHYGQFQQQGWAYLPAALQVQLQLGARCYDYQGHYASRAAALQAAWQQGRRLADFNLEQQAELARHYYFALKQGQDPRPWEPFVVALQEMWEDSG